MAGVVLVSVLSINPWWVPFLNGGNSLMCLLMSNAGDSVAGQLMGPLLFSMCVFSYCNGALSGKGISSSFICSQNGNSFLQTSNSFIFSWASLRSFFLLISSIKLQGGNIKHYYGNYLHNFAVAISMKF